MTVTWTSETGDWKVYLDGSVRSSGTDLSRGKLIKGRGLFVVGQEQDSYGGSYVGSESFVGTISQVSSFGNNDQGIVSRHNTRPKSTCNRI